MNKVIFLDIDGPVIPINVPSKTSFFRTHFNQESIKWINKLCEKTGAKIVTNSMHNYIDFFDGDLKSDLVSFGITKEYFHENWRTVFPYIDYSQINSSVRGIGRLYAIYDWLSKNDADNWVCFDDRNFTNLPNLILINDGMGVKKEHYDAALQLLRKTNDSLSLSTTS
jgi:hypothetical protein